LALPVCFWAPKKSNREGHKGQRKTAKNARKILVILRATVAGLSNTGLAKFVARASRTVKLRGAVHVLVTTSRELRSLNLRFRGKDQPTDVLSFVPEPGFADALAGDIAISAEIAKQNARRLGHSAVREIEILVLHGMLHLAGYDHERDHGVMAGEEVKLRKALGLPVGLIERTGQVGRRVRKHNTFSKSTRGKSAGGRARATPGSAATQGRAR